MGTDPSPYIKIKEYKIALKKSILDNMKRCWILASEKDSDNKLPGCSLLSGATIS